MTVYQIIRSYFITCRGGCHDNFGTPLLCVCTVKQCPSLAFYVKDDQLLMMDTNTEKIYPLTQHLNTESDTLMAGIHFRRTAAVFAGL